MQTITWNGDSGEFIILATDSDIQDCHAAEWPIVRWNTETNAYE